MNYIDGKNVNKEECQNIKKAVSKYGVTVVCDEAEEAEKVRRDADLVMPAGEECEKTKKVVSKHGVVVVCDEEA
ncbi:MAG: hypothetical protein IJE80_01000 [Peptococcaceae bacterium]|nr:hypothetical protein [Peptococcaceae bacterium]MBQ3510019.1 hypothetical protein [Peptococcaceae bacterium]